MKVEYAINRQFNRLYIFQILALLVNNCIFVSVFSNNFKEGRVSSSRCKERKVIQNATETARKESVAF